MNVLQHGDPDKIQEVINERTLVFKCNRCGCQFTAEEQECDLFIDETEVRIEHESYPWDSRERRFRITPRWFRYVCPDCKTPLEVRKDDRKEIFE